MLSKFQIARKECYETEGWLQILFDNKHLQLEEFKILRNLAGKIRKLLTSSCKTIENKMQK
jgi:four helix bundle protein